MKRRRKLVVSGVFCVQWSNDLRRSRKSRQRRWSQTFMLVAPRKKSESTAMSEHIYLNSRGKVKKAEEVGTSKIKVKKEEEAGTILREMCKRE